MHQKEGNSAKLALCWRRRQDIEQHSSRLNSSLLIRDTRVQQKPAAMLAAPENNSNEEFDQVISKIADYVYDFEIKSDKALTNAKVALLDALGCAYECLALSEACRKLVGPIYPGTAIVPNGFKLPGTRYQLDMMKGAFDMGVLIRYLDHNDAFFGAEWGHPSGNASIESRARSYVDIAKTT